MLDVDHFSAFSGYDGRALSMSDTEGVSAPVGASTLMRSLGLLVDGPGVWGAALRSRAAGVFVVELPGGLDRAPLNSMAIRQWLERVPELRMDGARPEATEFGARLNEFWLPGEQILYVGRSAKSIGSRVAAMYATPLGDARPFAGGHWLKALSVLNELRIWWAETDAHEEYADALLTEVAKRALPPAGAASGAGDTLPFANLVTTSGTARQHGIQHSLREPLAADAGAGPAARAAASKRATPRAGRPAATTARPRARLVKTPERPQTEPSYLSQDGLDRLHSELEQLRTGVRPGVIQRVKAARELGDLRENAEYESARKEQSFVEGRIQTLEALIKAAVVVDAPVATDAAGVGSTVVVEADGDELVFVLVGASEADPAAGRISYSSPVGQALLGRRAGDEVVARLPRGEMRYRVREVR